MPSKWESGSSPTCEDSPGLGDWLAASKLGPKGLEMNKDAVSDAELSLSGHLREGVMMDG